MSHLSTHLLQGCGASPMLRHRCAEDVGNLSGQPNLQCSCLCICAHASMCFHQGLSLRASQAVSPVQAVPIKSVSAELMLVATHWKLGHPGHDNLSNPSAQCDVHATQHPAVFTSPSPKYLNITECTIASIHLGRLWNLNLLTFTL